MYLTCRSILVGRALAWDFGDRCTQTLVVEDGGVRGRRRGIHASYADYRRTSGRWAFWAFVAVLAVLYVAATFGPPPETVSGLAWGALAGWLIRSSAGGSTGIARRCDDEFHHR